MILRLCDQFYVMIEAQVNESLSLLSNSKIEKIQKTKRASLSNQGSKIFYWFPYDYEFTHSQFILYTLS